MKSVAQQILPLTVFTCRLKEQVVQKEFIILFVQEHSISRVHLKQKYAVQLLSREVSREDSASYLYLKSLVKANKQLL